MTRSHRINKRMRKTLAMLAQAYPGIEAFARRWTTKNRDWAISVKLSEDSPVLIMRCAKSPSGEGDVDNEEFGIIRDRLTEGDLREINELYLKLSGLFGIAWKLAPLERRGVIEYRLFPKSEVSNAL